MENRYKIIIYNKNLYKEFEFPINSSNVKIGTSVGCDLRLHKDLFFEPIELSFRKNGESWSVFCSDNTYVSTGNIRKYMNMLLKHGDIFSIKYQESELDVFEVEFLIDFDNGIRKYEKAIDVKNCSTIKIGTKNSNQIILKSQYVNDDMIELYRSESDYELCIKNTTYGIYHNGTKVSDKCMIKNGDFFSISDFTFYYKNNVLWTELRDDIIISGISFKNCPEPNNYPKFIRNTRIKTVVNTDKIEILDPAEKPQKPKNNLFMTLFPSFGMLLTSGLMAMMGGSMVVFSLISGGFAIATALINTTQLKKEYEKDCRERIEKYEKYADNKRTEITKIRDGERYSLEQIYINVSNEQQLLKEFSSDLFDRKPEDEDFLKIRLGTGSVNSLREIEYKKQEKFESSDELQQIPAEISEEYKLLHNAPVVCDFKNAGMLGIIGDDKSRFAIMKNIIIDICLRHYYSDVQLFFIAEEEHKNAVRWLRFLPHVYNNAVDIRNIAYDAESKNHIYDFLYKELSQRDKESISSHFIVFFYDKCGYHTHPISKFSDKLKELSATFVFMENEKKNIPQGCSELIFVNSVSDGYIVKTMDKNDRTAFKYEEVDDKNAKQIVYRLAPVYTEEISLESALTKNISLYEMFNILMADDLDLENNWKNSEVFKSMAAPIGVTRNGIISLDLHDKAHGPHGLVAGTTGSGKSEILQTYILSAATLYHPYEIAFVIIDFKGGGMVNQFKELPHLLGAITNIDGKEITRSLKSIKAELQKRQMLFAEAEVNHIDKYIKKYKSGAVSVPIPHLVLIVDEFAELKAEQPDFMKELISAARIGRSLGVHLILATQKPSGQVDDQIWSNSKFKLCLKVQSKEDSNEVLKSPLAAEITEPGRAYLQVGNNEIFELFQSAYSGAYEKVSETNVKEFTLYEISESGKRKPVYVKKKENAAETNLTQLEAVVNYINEYCNRNNIEKLSDICLPPLSKLIDFPETNKKYNEFINIGIYDDPDSQIQKPAALDLDNKNTIIIGSSQNGKTNILQSVIKTIAMSSGPEGAAIYILDFNSMVLKNFESLCHVGGVVCSSEDEKLKNLFKLLIEEITSRKEKLISAGVSSFSSYIEAGFTDIPHIYLLIDNFTALHELYGEDDDNIIYIIREGIAAGISTIITNAQTSGISYRYLSNFSNKIALHCNDSSEYLNLFESSSLHPNDTAGRCIVEIDKRILECQTYLAFSGTKEIERVQKMQKFISSVNSRHIGKHAKKVPFIPKVLSETALVQDFGAAAEGYSIPVGITYNEVKPFLLDISQTGIMGICGNENKGHRNFIGHILKTLDKNKADNPVKVVIYDDVKRKLSRFKDMPVIEKYSVSTDDTVEVLKSWYDVLEARYDMTGRGETAGDNELLLMIINNNDAAKKISDDYEFMPKFNDMISKFRGMNFSVIFSDYQNVSLAYDAPEPLRLIKQERHILYFDDLDNLKPFDVSYEDVKANRKKLETGDAYYIRDNSVIKIKVVKSDKNEG